jgi:serine/threonine protein kinase
MAFHCVRCKKEIDKEFKACPHCGEPVTEFLRRYAEEPIDGKYQIVERLGAGGMGDVYKVNHTFLGTTRVIKVIRPQISESKDAHDRFLREARTATKVQHPNLATLHDFSALPDGSHYMVWEFIDGENVAQRIRTRGTLGPRYAVRIAIEALHGLEALHRAGIIHRDISPENIMITRGEPERVKVIDLGVAKVEDAEQATRVGIFVGKLRYASPEHLGFLNEGEKIDGRADLYSLAMVLYEMLTGRPPFEATSPHEYVLLHSRETQFKPLDLPADLPGGAQLQAVLARALERDRNKRYATAREFASALEQVEKTLPDPNLVGTINMPTPSPDMDATWRPGETLRTPLPAEPTVRTPLPAPMAGRPAEPTVVVAKARHGGPAAFLVIGLIILLAGAAIALLLTREPKDEPKTIAAAVPPPAQTQTVAPAPAQPQSTVEVITSAPITATTPELVETAPPVPIIVPPVTPRRTQPAPVQVPATPEARPRPAEPRPAPAPASVRTYVDGDSGDADANEKLIEELQRQLKGVRSVAVRGSGELHTELVDRLRADGVAINDAAATVIDFEGTLDRLGRGRKRRAAKATVTKDGRVIFRYELPAEEYRVGDSPAEAFAQVFTDAYGQ